jgi:Rrf2 family protein
MGFINSQEEITMLVSTKGRYALRIMTDLAEHQSKGYIPLKAVASRQGISEKYLEGIIKLLVQNKFLVGVRGKGGGYRLTKSPEQYTLADILKVTEQSLAPVSCLDPWQDSCPRARFCRTLPVWQGLNQVIQDYLDRITLADLIRPDQPGDDYII